MTQIDLIGLGMLVGLILISYYTTILGTPVYFNGIRIHHYVYGIPLALLGYYYRNNHKYSKYAYVLIGFGLVLIADQLPDVATRGLAYIVYG